MLRLAHMQNFRKSLIALVVVAVLGFLLYLNQVCTPDWKLIKLNSSLKELGNMLYSQWPKRHP